jgi:hypothetical protein
MRRRIATLASSTLSIITTATCLLLLVGPNQTLAQPADDCLRIRKIFGSQDSVKQGGDIELRVTVTASGCVLPIPAGGEGLRARVGVKTGPGLQAHSASMDFLKIEQLNQGSPMRYGARESTLYVRLTAAPDAVLGVLHPTFLLNYETIDPAGQSIPRIIEVEIPVNVVAHDAPVKMRTSAHKWDPGVILLIPFRAIQLLFTWDGC